MTTRDDAAARLRTLWAGLPPVRSYCRGLCADSCGGDVAAEAERWAAAMRLVVTPLERWLIEQATGRPWSPLALDCSGCSYWGSDGSCTVYDVRPTVCRLYGADPGFPCTHGCTPVMVEGAGVLALQAVAALSRSVR